MLSLSLLKGQFISEGQSLPKGWGVSWRTFDRIGAICHPVPLNIVIRHARNVWWYLCGFYPSYMDKRFNDYYQLGYSAGYDVARKQNKADGNERTWARVCEKLMELIKL